MRGDSMPSETLYPNPGFHEIVCARGLARVMDHSEKRQSYSDGAILNNQTIPIDCRSLR